MTAGMIEAGKIIGIEVMDHIIIGDENNQNGDTMYSFRENGLIT